MRTQNYPFCLLEMYFSSSPATNFTSFDFEVTNQTFSNRSIDLLRRYKLRFHHYPLLCKIWYNDTNSIRLYENVFFKLILILILKLGITESVTTMHEMKLNCVNGNECGNYRI